MADDKLLPRKLHQLHPRFGTPYLSIIICSLVVSVLVLLSFDELLVIDVTVYGAGLFLEYISLIWLRMRDPDAHRPFKIPLNIAGLCLLFLIPIAVYAIALCGMFSSTGIALLPALFAVGILLTAEVIWQIIKRTRPISH
jgi:amino acid transporter